MGECSYCGDQAMTFTCRYCGEKFCSEHRLPENHDCEGLEEGLEDEKTEKWFREKDTKQETVHGEPKPRKKPTFFREAINTFKRNATLSIIALTVVSFFLQYTLPGFYDFITLSPALTEAAVEATNQAIGGTLLTKTLLDAPWGLLTVMIAHGGFFHLFANMVTFYFFGTTIERVIGARELLKFYVLSGLAASIGYVAFRNLMFAMHGPAVGGIPALGPAVGASGAVVATVGIVAMLYPDAEVLLYFFIPMKIKTAVYFFGALEGANLVAKFIGINIPVIGMFASSAHLTGLIIGLWYGKKLQDRYRQNRGVLDLTGY